MDQYAKGELAGAEKPGSHLEAGERSHPDREAQPDTACPPPGVQGKAGNHRGPNEGRSRRNEKAASTRWTETQAPRRYPHQGRRKHETGGREPHSSKIPEPEPSGLVLCLQGRQAPLV